MSLNGLESVEKDKILELITDTNPLLWVVLNQKKEKIKQILWECLGCDLSRKEESLQKIKKASLIYFDVLEESTEKAS